MPSEKELTQFYKEEYWDHRGDQDQTVNPRDLSHYLDLRSLAGKVIDAPELKFLNFGAGHGGLSHIMWGIGANIVNIDPSIPPVSYATRWRSFLSENDAIGPLTKEKPFP
jgi:2-polyprenyl-3-methyl-5-hydroxy-6-metoxy-1,4-benzoquinol methylase